MDPIIHLRAHPTLLEALLEENGGDHGRAYVALRALVRAAFEEGVEQERARCMEHLELGELSGSMAIALEGVRSGKPVSAFVGLYQAAAVGPYRGALVHRRGREPGRRVRGARGAVQ